MGRSLLCMRVQGFCMGVLGLPFRPGRPAKQQGKGRAQQATLALALAVCPEEEGVVGPEACRDDAK